MKHIYLILILWLIADWAHAQKTILFQIDGPNKISAIVDGQKSLKKDTVIFRDPDQTLSIEIKDKAGLKYKFRIYRGENILIEKTEKDFAVTPKLITDKDLKLNTFSLDGKFDVSILPIQENNSAASPFKRSFTIALNPQNVAETDKGNPTKPRYKPGIPYYDAYALVDVAHTTTADWVRIFRYYCNNMKLQNNDEVLKEIKGNRFLETSFVIKKENYQTVKKSDREAGAQSGGTEFISGKALTSIGGLDVTNIADGFAKFLVKRTKEELNVAFFSKFKKTLNDSTFRDLKTLFPKTCELLEAIGEEIYNYNRYLQNLREAFQSDIKTLDENLPGIIPNHSGFFDQHFELAIGLNSACYITTSLKNQVHPGDILDNYPVDKIFIRKGESDYFNKNWSGAIQTLQLLSESFRDSSSLDDDKYWVDGKKIKEMVNNTEVFKIYLGLIYQLAKTRHDSIQYRNGSLVMLMDAFDFDNDYNAYKRYISNFAFKVNEVNEMLKKYKYPKNDSVAIENYTKFFKSSVGLIEYCTEVSNLPHFDKIIKINLHSSLQNYFKITYETSDLVIDINRRNYSSAVNRALSIYSLIRTKPLENDLKQISPISINDKKPNKNISCKEKRAKRKYDKAVGNYVKNVVDPSYPGSRNFKIVLSPDSTLLVKKIAKTDPVVNSTRALLKEIKTRSTDTAKIDSLVRETTSLLNSVDSLAKANAQHDTVVIRMIDSGQKAETADSLQKSRDVLKNLVRYGTFMSTVATAKNSDDVEKAIEAAALPSGSSRIKRETPFNVSLNAYCGLFAGYERIKGVDQPWIFCKINSYGVTAPIGVSISTGGHSFAFAWPNNEGHWSYSAFISLIDIGAVAAFRFQNNDSINQVPTIKLQDIFSPGLFFSVGFPKCPLSLNLGAQVGPNLRNVYVEDKNNPGQYINSYQNNVYWRFSASLVVDIPIFNFYTKSKK
jgi:hypothetical protein